MSQKVNHLRNETSPYLQQHAHNPVDWYPWGNEALEKARRENKPILLSIGYAACHWCHVMAHESFEDQTTADLMNQLFINIKVDREERPDLDKVYQTAHYLLTQRSGGWPLTVFLTPDDLTPFFSGTYFPLQARYQLPAFKNVLQSIAELYHQRADDIKLQNASLLKILSPPSPIIADLHLNSQPIQHALQSLQNNFDEFNGGFGGAPKFPQPARLEFLLQNESNMAEITLLKMARGGIYDQLAGGFYRYSVDAEWRIPHFEKMLYDNAQLLFLYARTYKQTNDADFATIARNTAEWILTNMQSPQGGYYSSYDADSEGHEGKYYVWDRTDIKALLEDAEFAVIEMHFGLDQPPNFEHKWHFYIAQPLETVAKKLGITLIEANNFALAAKSKLLTARNQRIAPGRDEKILTSWNALTIKAMFTAGEILQEPRYIESAQRALSFIQQKLWINHRLLATSKDNKSHLPAYLDDYAFLIDALLTSLQVSWNTDDLLFAQDLAETVMNYFFDDAEGGFFFTAVDHEKLLYRPKTMMDEAIPAGNGIIARAFLVLGNLLGEMRYLNAAEKTLHAAWSMLIHYPAEHCSLLMALQEFLYPSQLVIIRGSKNEIQIWQEAVKSAKNYVFAISDDEHRLPETIAAKKIKGKACAYICQGTECLAVIENLEELKKQIKSASQGHR